jgi:hypothetical protein
LAHNSDYSIVTYQRRPGHWRAAIRLKKRGVGIYIPGRTIDSFVTPDDCPSEPDAAFAAEKLIKKL